MILTYIIENSPESHLYFKSRRLHLISEIYYFNIAVLLDYPQLSSVIMTLNT